MNLFIHGLDGNIQLGNSYFDDRHATLKADYVLANPPFNDGSKGDSGWGAERIADKDPRLTAGGQKMALSPRNANTMWMLHFLSHLKESGTAGFVMATYRQFRTESPPSNVLGFCGVATTDEIRDSGYRLTPGRYVGAEESPDEIPFEERLPKLTAALDASFEESRRLEASINRVLTTLRR